MNIGDEVIIKRKRKSGEKNFKIDKGTIINIYESYVLVRLKKGGFRECFKENELCLGG